MKKFGMIFALAAVVGLSGCSTANNDVQNDADFAKFLSVTQSYTVNDFNKGLSFLGDINLNDIELPLNEIEITDTYLNMTVDTDEGTEHLQGYMWREKETNKDYLHVGGRMTGEGIYAYKVDVNAIQDSVDSAIDLVVDEMESGLEEFDKAVDSGEIIDFNNNGIIEPNEIIDNILSAEGIDTEEVNFKSILETVKFNASDFESKGNGEYKLKTSSLIEALEEATNEKMFEDEEDYETLEDVLDIRLNYSNNHLNEVSVEIDVENEYEDTYCSSYDNNGNYGMCGAIYSYNHYKYEYTVNFEYEEDEISRIVLNYNVLADYFDGYDENEIVRINAELALATNEMSAVLKVGDSLTSYDHKFELYVTSENAKTSIDFSAVYDNTEVVDMNLGLIGTWLSEGTMTVNGGEGEKITATIESSVNVVVPSGLKDKEVIDVTGDVLDAIDEMVNEIY